MIKLATNWQNFAQVGLQLGFTFVSLSNFFYFRPQNYLASKDLSFSLPYFWCKQIQKTYSNVLEESKNCSA